MTNIDTKKLEVYYSKQLDIDSVPIKEQGKRNGYGTLAQKQQMLRMNQINARDNSKSGLRSSTNYVVLN